MSPPAQGVLIVSDLPLFDGGETRLAELEDERVRLMEKLAEIAKEQKALQSRMRRVERDLKAELRHIEEHWVPEDRELTLEDVEKWCRSAYFNMAHTMPGNPHCYFARSKVRRPDMYERVVAYVLAHGYPQKYGRSTYTCLDVRMNGGTWFLWPMTDRPEESEVLNLKPDSMRPEERAHDRTGRKPGGRALRPSDRPDLGAPPPRDTILINGTNVVQDRMF